MASYIELYAILLIKIKEYLKWNMLIILFIQYICIHFIVVFNIKQYNVFYYHYVILILWLFLVKMYIQYVINYVN